MAAIEIHSLSPQKLAVPGAALAFGGLAAALFLWPIHGPNLAPTLAALEPPVQAISNPFREVRQIPLISAPTRDEASAPIAKPIEFAQSTAPVEPLVLTSPETASTPAPERTAKRAAALPRSAPIRRPSELRSAGKDRTAVKAPAKLAERTTVSEEAPGMVAWTVDAGARAATFVAGGVKGTRDTVFGLGRTVAGFVTDSL
jgi:hypothetical protein